MRRCCCSPTEPTSRLSSVLPVAAVDVYPRRGARADLDVIGAGSRYALTGAVIADDRQAVLSLSRQGRLCQRKQADRGGGGASAVRRAHADQAPTSQFAVEPAAVRTRRRAASETLIAATDHLPAWRSMAGWTRTRHQHACRQPSGWSASSSARRSPAREVVRRFVPATLGDVVDDIVTALRDSGRYLISTTWARASPCDAAAAVRSVPGRPDVLGAAAIACDGATTLECPQLSLGRALGTDGEESRWTAPAPSVSGPSGWRLGAMAPNHTTTGATLSISGDLRVGFPWLGTVCRPICGTRWPVARVGRGRESRDARHERPSVTSRDAARSPNSYLRRVLRVLTGGEAIVATRPGDHRGGTGDYARLRSVVKVISDQMLYGVPRQTIND